jgi:anti-sigma B factor antagonist
MARISRLADSVHPQFRVEVPYEGRTVVVAVEGELDLASSPELERALNRITTPPTALLVIDLSRLEFMDSTGLSTIVRAHQRLADVGCEVAIVKGSAQVQRLLDLTGVADRLRVADTLEILLDGS